MSEETLVMSVKQLQEALQIGRATAYRLVNRDDFPAIHVGGRIFIPRKRLEAWLDSCGDSMEV